MKPVFSALAVTSAMLAAASSDAQTNQSPTIEVCGKSASSAISRIDLSQRIKKASLLQTAQRKQALNLQSDDTILVRMPPIDTIYAGSNVPSFTPNNGMCGTAPNTLRNMLLLGVMEVGRAATTSCVRVSRAGEMQSAYEAQNAFGAKVRVQQLRFESVSIFMGWLNPDGMMQQKAPQFYGAPSDVGIWRRSSEMDDPLRMPMSKAEETDWRRFGNKYLLLRIRSPYAFFEFGGQSATYSNPTQEERRDYYIVADVTCIATVNQHDVERSREFHLPMLIQTARTLAVANEQVGKYILEEE